MLDKRYNVGIVDDQLDEIALILYYIRDISAVELLWVEHQPLEALKKQDIQPVDILIVDMHMPKLNGVEFVKALKQLPVIIVCTNYTKYAYAMSPYQLAYIPKNVSREEFKLLMDKAIHACGEKYNHKSFEIGRITVPTSKRDGSKMPILYGNLVFASVLDKVMSFYFDDGTSKQGIISMEALMNLLPKPPFMRVQKSYMVCMNYVEEFSYKEISLKNTDHRIPIGKTYGKKVRDMLLGKAPFIPGFD